MTNSQSSVSHKKTEEEERAVSTLMGLSSKEDKDSLMVDDLQLNDKAAETSLLSQAEAVDAPDNNK